MNSVFNLSFPHTVTNCGTSYVSHRFYAELWAETAEERRLVDKGHKHQRNQLVSFTEGEIRKRKTRRSKSSCYNQVGPQIMTLIIH